MHCTKILLLLLVKSIYLFIAGFTFFKPGCTRTKLQGRYSSSLGAKWIAFVRHIYSVKSAGPSQTLTHTRALVAELPCNEVTSGARLKFRVKDSLCAPPASVVQHSAQNPRCAASRRLRVRKPGADVEATAARMQQTQVLPPQRQTHRLSLRRVCTPQKKRLQ